MKPAAIPEDVQKKVEEVIEKFNKKTFGKEAGGFVVRFKGKHLYLDRDEDGDVSPMCRLTYTGTMDGWKFAMFKWSDERYDAEEFGFPGEEHLDGTVEGAMKAALEAYEG